MSGISDKDLLKSLEESFQNPITLETHKNRLRYLLELSKSNKNLFYILSHPKKYIPRITNRYPNKVATQKNMVTTVLSLFHCRKLACVIPEQHAEWKVHHALLREEERDFLAKNKPSPEQEENYVTYTEIKEKFKLLKKESDVHDLRYKSQRLCLLAFIVYQIPKRAELGNVRIYREGQSPVVDNYITLSKPPQESTLIIKKYKGSESLNKQPIVEKLHPKFVKVLQKSLKAHPRSFLFVKRDNNPYATNQEFSHHVIRTMKSLFDGRAMGVSLIRHMYITEKIDFNNSSTAEREEIAKAMGHSKAMQDRYNWILASKDKKQ